MKAKTWCRPHQLFVYTCLRGKKKRLSRCRWTQYFRVRGCRIEKRDDRKRRERERERLSWLAGWEQQQQILFFNTDGNKPLLLLRCQFLKNSEKLLHYSSGKKKLLCYVRPTFIKDWCYKAAEASKIHKHTHTDTHTHTHTHKQKRKKK